MKNAELKSYWDESKRKDWENFVGLCKEEWIDSPEQIKLLELLENNKDIAVVVNYQLGDSAINWIYRKIPALGNRIPVNCLKSGKSKMSLRETLLQMPSR